MILYFYYPVLQGVQAEFSAHRIQKGGSFMAVNGMHKDDWKPVDKQLDSLTILCNALEAIPKNIEQLIDGESDRQDYLEEHNRDTNEDISSELEDINTYLTSLSDLLENLNDLRENLETLKEYK